MSVRTEADERLDRARENIQAVIEDLSGIVTGEAWGSDDFKDTFRTKVKSAFDDALAVKKSLG